MNTIRFAPLESLAVCDPVNAIERAKQSNATTEELRYLSCLIKVLGNKMDRFITVKIRQQAKEFAKINLLGTGIAL